MIDEAVPEARVSGRPWARFVNGPAIATSSGFAWAATQALAACVLQGVWFLIASDIGSLALLAIVLTATIQWTITTVAMAAVARLAPMLHRQPGRASARLVGAMITALVAIAIEMVAAGSYVTWFEGAWRGSFYFVALGTGAVWGLWLPGVGASSMRVA